MNEEDLRAVVDEEFVKRLSERVFVPSEDVVVVRQDLHGGRFEPIPEPGVVFIDVTAEGVDFSGQEFPYFATQGATFRGCDFSKAGLTNSYLGLSPRTVFQDCSFAGADLRRAELGDVRFERCSFRGAKIRWGSASRRSSSSAPSAGR